MDQNDEIEIDLIDMCKYILSKWVFILLGIIICAGAAFGFVKLRSKTVYIDKMKIYVSVPQTSDKVLIRDSADQLVQDYIELIKTDLVIEKIAKETGLKQKYIKESLTAEQVEGIRYITISVETKSKAKTKKISKKVLPCFMETIEKDLGKKYKPIVVEQPEKIEISETMSVKKYVVVGAAGGFVIVAGIFFIAYLVMISKKLRN